MSGFDLFPTNISLVTSPLPSFGMTEMSFEMMGPFSWRLPLTLFCQDLVEWDC